MTPIIYQRKIMNKINSLKKFVADHKVGIAIAVTAVTTATICIALNQTAVKQWNNFLQENDLFDKFYYEED